MKSKFDFVKLETDFGAFLPFENQGFGITRMNWKKQFIHWWTKGEKTDSFVISKIETLFYVGLKSAQPRNWNNIIQLEMDRIKNTFYKFIVQNNFHVLEFESDPSTKFLDLDILI